MQSAFTIPASVIVVATKPGGTHWDEVKRQWFDYRFLQTIHGVRDIAAVVQKKKSREGAPGKLISFIECDALIGEL